MLRTALFRYSYHVSSAILLKECNYYHITFGGMCSKMCLTRVLICLVIITLRIMIRGVVRTLAMVNCS